MSTLSAKLNMLRTRDFVSALPIRIEKMLLSRLATFPGAISFSNGDLDRRIALAAATTDISVSQSKKQSGNYRKGRFTVDGLTIAIESPRGSLRSGVDASGKSWSVRMPAHYGYVAKTTGADDSAIDVFLGPNSASRKVFVVDQAIDGQFDEHKAVLFCDSIGEARNLYLSSYSPGWNGLQDITEMSWSEFRKWAFEGDTTVPLSARTGALPITKDGDTAFAFSCSIAKQYESGGNLYLYGPVLVPDVVDRQGDVVSVDEIRKCARRFMERQQGGLRHQTMVPRTGIRLTQNFIAPEDFVVNGKKIMKGSWVIEFEVIDKTLQNKVRSGEYRAFSIGGRGRAQTI